MNITEAFIDHFVNNFMHIFPTTKQILRGILKIVVPPLFINSYILIMEIETHIDWLCLNGQSYVFMLPFSIDWT